MGGSQSRQDDVPFDLFYCNCWQGACYESSHEKKNAVQHTKDNYDHTSNEELKARYRMQFANANFDLDAAHPFVPPCLGTSYWEVIPPSSAAEEEDVEEAIATNLLDVSHTEPHNLWTEESNDNPNNNSVMTNATTTSTTTPPQTPKRTITAVTATTLEHFPFSSGPIISSPHPMLRESPSNVSDSCSTIRTATTTSTLNSSSMVEIVTHHNYDTHKRGGIEVTFTPRRLFDNVQEEEQDQFLNTPTPQQQQPPLFDEHVHYITPPTTPHSVRAMNASSNPIYCGDTACDVDDVVLCDGNNPPTSPCGFDSPRTVSSILEDPSIVLRNGVLIQAGPGATTTLTETTGVIIPSSPSRGAGGSTVPTTMESSSSSSQLISDGVECGNQIHVNTLPSNRPIHLKITERYAGYSSNLSQPHYANTVEENNHGADGDNAVNASNLSLLSDVGHDFFSYDPYFSVGEYTISTSSGHAYGNGLSLKMGEQYMTLMDRNGRVWGVTRSRHTFLPSCVIYSPKAKYPSQIPSSHRPSNHHWGGDDGAGGNVGGGDAVELYPWALVKKEGRGMEHDVRIHLVEEPGMQSGEELVGGLFSKKPTFRCRHGLDEKKAHSHTIVYRIQDACEKSRIKKSNTAQKEIEIPCCMMIRDPIHRDLVDVTIAPGIDPLLMICYLAVHFKMVS